MKPKLKVLSFFMALILLVSANLIIFGELSDISNHWAKNQINRMVDLKVVNGYPDGSFGPDKNMTKAEFYKVINSLAGLKMFKKDFSFADVKETDWFYENVAIGVTIGYITESGNLNPNSFITREDVARIIGFVYQLEQNSAVADAFLDATQMASAAKGYIGAMKSKGYINGYPDGNFVPKGQITRAEVVTMLNNIFDKETPRKDTAIVIPEDDKDDYNDKLIAIQGLIDNMPNRDDLTVAFVEDLFDKINESGVLLADLKNIDKLQDASDVAIAIKSLNSALSGEMNLGYLNSVIALLDYPPVEAIGDKCISDLSFLMFGHDKNKEFKTIKEIKIEIDKLLAERTSLLNEFKLANDVPKIKSFSKKLLSIFSPLASQSNEDSQRVLDWKNTLAADYNVCLVEIYKKILGDDPLLLPPGLIIPPDLIPLPLPPIIIPPLPSDPIIILPLPLPLPEPIPFPPIIVPITPKPIPPIPKP